MLLYFFSLNKSPGEIENSVESNQKSKFSISKTIDSIFQKDPPKFHQIYFKQLHTKKKPLVSISIILLILEILIREVLFLSDLDKSIFWLVRFFDCLILISWILLASFKYVNRRYKWMRISISILLLFKMMTRIADIIFKKHQPGKLPYSCRPKL